eukprot:CAMPEP_0184295808 /NCGR_PEP_ID=MMETSP1049-20130417/6710_1 /TAXON_ID=77928 /ORGANISM="Proteomonas sulcata, Strain CCMP704" /LENGTH=72 /DNA_ID=CAMNT_0026604599 /DNA_START=52 /DNA_END=270 /DNA_ORIENTATION=+
MLFAVPLGALYQWNHSARGMGVIDIPAEDPDSVYNQWDPPPATLDWNLEILTVPGPAGDPDSIYNQFPPPPN